MPEDTPKASRVLPKKGKLPWRRWLRSLHRDAGFFVVGLTVIYAVSGLAVNHIGEWDPNFVQYQKDVDLGHAISGSDDEVAATALAALDLDAKPEEVYSAAPDELEVYLADGKTIHVDPTKGTIHAEGQKPRFFLRVANWLHLNRGKKAWTYFADGYAVLLLFLAGSGMFMLAGRKGLLGRGGVFLILGVLVPVLYITLSGGP